MLSSLVSSTGASLAPSLTLRLPRSALSRRDAITRLAATWQAKKLFAFKCDELEFARALLQRRTNLWLYRTSQRAFAGDFIVVDVSSPKPATRTVSFIELKTLQPVKVVESTLPTSVQLRNAPAALRELAGTGVIEDGEEHPRVRAIIGDRREVLSYLS
jgi:hypothetical protein